MFGCLFAGCKRWPDNTEFASFNFSCSTQESIEEELGIKICRPIINNKIKIYYKINNYPIFQNKV